MSQCADILAVLADGRPHRMEEIHQRVGFCRLNSRVAELRGRGHVIECDKTGGNYTYLLLAASEEGSAFAAADPSSDAAVSAEPHGTQVTDPASVQLSLVAA